MRNYEQEILQYVKDNIENFNQSTHDTFDTLVFNNITIKKVYAGRGGYDEHYQVILKNDKGKEEIITINTLHSLFIIIQIAMTTNSSRNRFFKSFVETHINKLPKN